MEPPVPDGVGLDDLTDRALLKAVLATTLRVESLMTQMNEALGRLSTAVTEQRDRMQDQIDPLTGALAAERKQAASTASAEAAEDVAQDQALADARAATDAALADLTDGVNQVNALADQISQAQQADQPAEPAQPVAEEPAAPAPAPAPEVPGPTPSPEQPQPPQPLT
jgi:uncharacterized phage infection (PIP) family protein YhgE